MPTRRSRPMMIAPFIPLWGILAFFGAEQLRGTKFMIPFIAFMAMLLIALFAHVARQAMLARRSRQPH